MQPNTPTASEVIAPPTPRRYRYLILFVVFAVVVAIILLAVWQFLLKDQTGNQQVSGNNSNTVSTGATTSQAVPLEKPTTAFERIATDTNQIKLELSLDDLTSRSEKAGVAELRFKFDSAQLTLVDIQVPDKYLAVDKQLDSNDGTAGVDIAVIGGGNFVPEEVLVTLTFTTKEGYVPGTAKVEMRPNTTIGIPNLIQDGDQLASTML